jgi:regulator of extracellular matrix RemA (YlzA/DUF370 family)
MMIMCMLELITERDKEKIITAYWDRTLRSIVIHKNKNICLEEIVDVPIGWRLPTLITT